MDEKSEQSLGDQATFAGQARASRERDDLSLGDERTLGGGDAAGLDTVIDDIEIVDLEARYKIEGTLGQGGMGAVLLATDTRLGRKVAIKRILGEAARSKTAMQRFLTEARSIAAISHPNVVQIYELGVAKDGPFLVIEYIDGGSLLDLCKAGPIAAERAIGLIAQVCDGLGRAHDVGIVHRDIKPANVLVTRDGIAKLTDFGLAKSDVSDHQMTMTGAVMGTPDFMPPEQRRDAAEVDHRSDLWSLAATLYQAITGRSPKVIRLHELPVDLQPIVAKALEDSKDARYQSAREFRDDLKATIRAVTPEGPAAALREGQCPACGAQNDPKRKFCRGCGTSLEAACLACGEGMPMWDEICGSCGAKQSPLIDARVAERAAAQAQAEEFLGSCEFAKAETALNALRAEMHPRLTQLRPWVEQFATRIETSRQENLARAAEAVQQALAHEQAFDYSAGIRALEPIPAAVRRLALPEANGTAGDVYDRLQQKAAATVSLEEIIRDAVAARNLVGLLPQVVALAELRPDRADVAKLRGQLEARARAIAERREATLARAREAHARQDYEAALKLLEQIGSEGTNDEVERFASENRLLEAQSLSLRQQITEATAAGRLDGLVELIDEYCVIKPTTPKLVSLRAKAAEHAERIAEQARRVAKRKRVMRVASGVVLGILAIVGIAAKLWRDAALERAEQVRLAIEAARWDQALALPPLRNSIGMELKLLPAGRFTMGQMNGSRDETPHEVTLTKPFYIGVYEVTNAQWQRVMGSVPSKWKDADRPVEQVSWSDAVEFCRKLSALPEERRAGREYRLPTEAEWEYACRAGSTTQWSFGDDEAQLGDCGWFDGNSGNQTHPVGQKQPNAWGLFDMHGNVWEWCSDGHEDYGSSAVTDPQGPSGASARVYRGGSWSLTARYSRSAFRNWNAPSSRSLNLGFRLALSPSEAQPQPPEAVAGN